MALRFSSNGFGISLISALLLVSKCATTQNNHDHTKVIFSKRYIQESSGVFVGALPVTPSTYRFSGSNSQYCKFPPWGSVQNAHERSILSFQFRTSRENSFLVYLDDGGRSSYIYISLQNRTVRLRYKFGESAPAVLTGGLNLNDNRWHVISVERKYPSITLLVDGQSLAGKVKVKSNSDLVTGSFTYIGSLPKTYRIQTLSFPIAFYEEKFVGSVRQVAINGKFVRTIAKLQVQEVPGNQLCSETRNPCKNNGACFVRGEKQACDCSSTMFKGKFCESYNQETKALNEAVATFRGSEWFSYDLSHQAISSYNDQISLSFKTRQNNGLLLHTGKSADYVNLSLQKGVVQLVVNLGSGAIEVLVEPVNGSFSDNRWHSVMVNRTLRRVDIVVDQARVFSRHIQDDFNQLTLDDVIYVGGSPDTSQLPGSRILNNFIGCLKEVSYTNGDFIRLDLSRLARARDPTISTTGSINFICSDVDLAGPLTFTTPNANLVVPSWTNSHAGSIEFNFRTNEPNGLLLYASGQSSDVFALELYQGIMHMVCNLGSGVSRYLSERNMSLDDGQWHRVSVHRQGKDILMAIDGVTKRYRVAGTNSNLDLDGNLFIGGAPFGNGFHRLANLWTAPLRQGFVGCVRDMRIDGNQLDLQLLAKSRGSNLTPASLSRDIGPYCRNLENSQCASNPCLNGAICKEGMNRFICDCSNTSYKGTTCDQAVMASGFDGNQYMLFPMSSTLQTDGEEISLRFKTPMSSGLLFATTSNASSDVLTIEIVQRGQLKLTINIECSMKNCTAPRQGPDNLYLSSGLNDRMWHTVKVSRRGRRIALTVDGRTKQSTLTGRHNKLEFDAIHLGSITSHSSNYQAVLIPGFVGHIENVIFNLHQLLDSCIDQSIVCKTNASWGNSFIVANPVNFKGPDSYVALRTLDAYLSMNLFFSLKTSIQDGLLLYNSGSGSDFIAIEIVAGKIYYIYNLGNGAQVLSIPQSSFVNDNEWHDIRIIRDVNNRHTLFVDDVKIIYRGTSTRKNLDLSGDLYIGGVRQDMFYNKLPEQISSRSGFRGCIGSLDLNGRTSDIIGRDRIASAGTVVKGCHVPSLLCTSTTCSNGGTCRQEWDNFTCDCSMTTYVGRRCQQHVQALPEGTTYQFGSQRGIIIYHWRNTFPSSRVDEFTVGFTTSVRDCAIMRVEGKIEQDFVQLTIESGRLTLRFNIGNSDVELQEPMSVSDGQYHTVRVRRKWMNATLRVDNWPERTVAAKGGANDRYALAKTSIPTSVLPAIETWLRRKEHSNTVFNSQSLIQIGGLLESSSLHSRAKRTSNINMAFLGQMMGFFFNDVRVFQLAAQGDPRVQLIGDVRVIGDPTIPTINPPTTTMATLTTFSTTESSEVQHMDGCDNEKICSISSGSTYESNIGSNTVDGSINHGARNATGPVSSGLNRNKSAFVSRLPPPVLPVHPSRTIPTTQSSPSILIDDGVIGTVMKSNDGTVAADEILPRITLTKTDQNGIMVENEDGLGQMHATGSVPIVEAKTSSMTTAVIVGIAAAATCCVLGLLFVMYRYRSRDEISYNVDERERSYGNLPGKGKKGSNIGRNGLVVGKPVHSNSDKDKEYYV